MEFHKANLNNKADEMMRCGTILNEISVVVFQVQHQYVGNNEKEKIEYVTIASCPITLSCYICKFPTVLFNLCRNHKTGALKSYFDILSLVFAFLEINSCSFKK